ncbi:hypothetical protein [Xylocopilactobacillus apicola]|nr:hypothetical protein [Xylocopilactobacillus apicola]
MFKKNKQRVFQVVILLTTIWFQAQLQGNVVLADDNSYTPAESTKIKEARLRFSELTSRDVARGSYDIYSVPPVFMYPFKAGFLKQDFLSTTTEWINYYRFLLNLPPATNAAISYEQGTANNFAQLGAYLLAASNADPMKYQHNLTNATKPYYIPQSVWDNSKKYTNFAVLYFNGNSPVETSYYPIANLIADNYDYLTPNATGHRAELLSSRLSNFGIGVAYGNNGIKYEDIYFDNTTHDVSSNPSRTIVNYPAESVFPIEELVNNNSDAHPIYWSIYFSNDYLIPRTGLSVTVKDDTTGVVGNATKVQGVAPDNITGYYASAVTYLPPKNVELKVGDRYTVTLSGLDPTKYQDGQYQYSFKLFNETGGTNPSLDIGNVIDMPQESIATVRCVKGSIPVYNGYTSSHHETGEFLPNNSQWKSFGISYANNTFWFNVGNHQWIDGKYVETASQNDNSVATIDYEPGYGIRVWTSPYFNKQPVGEKYLITGTQWKVFHITTINNTNWFNVGGNQWIDGRYVKTIIK